MRIISAGNDEGNWEEHTNIDTEMSLWLGSDHVQYPKTTLKIGNNHKHSLSDKWRHTSGDKNTLENDMESPDASQLDRSRHHFQRFCGWNLVYDLPRAHSSDQYVQVQAFKIDSKEYSLLDVCTQDLFITLIRSMSAFNWRNMDKTTVAEFDWNIRLENPALTILTRAFIDNGLGTLSHAIGCIVPPFRTQTRLQDESLSSTLVRAAEKYRQNGEWERGEVVLRWACKYFSLPSEQGEQADSRYPMIALRAIGEFYRWSLSKITNERQKFGQAGIKWMKETYGDSNDIVASYINIATRIKHHASNNQFHDKGNSDNENNFVNAIKDRRRTDALYYLCYINGDFTSSVLREALPLAGRNGWVEVIDAILEMNGNPNSQDEQGRTVASYCAEMGYQTQLRRLIDMGAVMEITDKQRRSPLHWAALTGREDIVRILLDTNQVDYNRQDENDSTPLIFAVHSKQEAIVQLLLKKGVNIEAKNNDGYTALIQAIFSKDKALTQLLLEKGAKIKAKDDIGYTPLIRAVRLNQEAIVQLLLEKGANIEAKDNNGRTPLSWAHNKGHDSITNLLKEWGAIS